MLKSLGTRAIVPVAVSVTGFVVVCCILLYSGVKEDMVRDTVQHEINLADTIIQSARYAMLQDDREALRNIVSDIGDHEGIEHVRIFNKKGLVMFSSREEEIHRFVDKQAEGCAGCHSGPVASTKLGPMEQARRFVNERGRSVLAITAPIYNEPDCYSAQCHFHTEGEALLGTLDLGLSAAPLQGTLSSLRRRMAGFSLMVLILTVGGVSALLRRSVLLPVQRLTEFTRAVNRGELGRELPADRGQVGELAASFQRMAADLNQARSELLSLRGSRSKPVNSAPQGTPSASSPPHESVPHGP
jgi:HAMP domain-containing protein